MANAGSRCSSGGSRAQCRRISRTRLGPSRGTGGTGMRWLWRCHRAGKLTSGHGTSWPRAYSLCAWQMRTYTRPHGILWRGGLDVLRRGGGARGEAVGAVRGRGGGDMCRRASEVEPEASWSCLVFLLKGQRPIMVARSMTMAFHDPANKGQRALATGCCRPAWSSRHRH
jgi:hypothetical protein